MRTNATTADEGPLSPFPDISIPRPSPVGFKSTLNDLLGPRGPKPATNGTDHSTTPPRLQRKELVDNFAKHIGLHQWLQDCIDSVSLVTLPQSVAKTLTQEAKISTVLAEMLAKSVTLSDPKLLLPGAPQDLHALLGLVILKHPQIKLLQEKVQFSLKSKRGLTKTGYPNCSWRRSTMKMRTCSVTQDLPLELCHRFRGAFPSSFPHQWVWILIRTELLLQFLSLLNDRT